MTSRPRTDDHDPFNTQRPQVHDLKGWRWLVFFPVAWLMRLYFRTWRFRVPEPDRSCLMATPGPRLVVIWHNRSLASPRMLSLLLEPENFVCLISPSRMAAWEVAFFRMFGFRIVRGSSTRRSIQAAIEMLRSLRNGHDVGLSPDGPSGPLYSFQRGAVSLARKARVPLLLMVPNCRRALRMNTWDRHLVPLPFARVTVRMRAITPEDPLWNQPDEEVAHELRRVCLEMTEDPFRMPNHEH